MTKKLTAVLIAGTMLLTGCGQPQTPEKTVMTIGDVNVSGGIFEFYMNSYMGAFSTDEAKEITLDQCKKNYLVVALGKAMGIEFDEKTQEDISDYKQSIIDSYKNSDYEGGYNGFLKDNNLVDSDIDMLISVSYYGQELQKKLDPVEYTDDEKRQYFRDHYRRAKHILITADDTMSEEEQNAAKAKAEELLQKAQNGENFDTLVSENSDDPGSTANPDGYFFTDDEMVPEFQDGVDAIAPGEFTLVKSTYGYHVIQRLPLDDNAELFETEYGKVSDSIQTKLDNKRFEEQAYKWADEYGIETNVDDAAVDEIASRVGDAYEKAKQKQLEKQEKELEQAAQSAQTAQPEQTEQPK